MASLLDKRLILVTGKGGVGRSTVAAALASAAARSGRRTLLYEANANDRFGSFFDREPVGPEITRLKDHLYALNTNPTAALEEYGLMVLRFKSVYKMVFENRVTRYFLRAIPGLDDYAVLGKAWYHTTETEGGRPRWDTIVFDMPASGHTMTMLEIPRVITKTVPDGPLTRDAHKVAELLRDKKRTALVLVTLAEEMPANEARELTEKLDSSLGMPVSRLVINQIYPDHFPEGSVQAKVLDKLVEAYPPAADDPGVVANYPAGLPGLVAHARLHASRRRLNERYLESLRRDIDAPVSELPYLFVPQIGPAELRGLSHKLEADLAG